MKLIYIDVETGGTNPSRDALLQLAGIIEIDGKEVESFNFFIQPAKGKSVSSQALKVNGIKKEDIENFLQPGQAYRKFIEILSKYIDKYNKKDKFFFIGYNAKFDEAFVRQFFLDNGDKYFGSWFYFPIIDVAILAGMYLIGERKQLENFKLGTVLEYLNLN